MSAATPQRRAIDRWASLALLLEWALGLRIAAANLVQWFSQRKGTLCLFPDTGIYWHLARMIRRGAPFEVLAWGDIPHFALRTPGYPLFLAFCQLLFGESLLAVRLVQALLGAVSVWLVFRLTRQVAAEPPGAVPRRRWTVPLLAAGLATFDPYFVGTSALVLSEALFIVFMLLSLWGLAVLWPSGTTSAPSRPLLWAALVGLATGAAVLVKPSWALCPPGLLLAWIALSNRRLSALRGVLVITLVAALVMTPWWIRNARIYGKFVPTALWMGASLYDGINPRATGASDMRFMDDPDTWPLDEETQDRELRRRALAFAREHPGRVVELAAIKFARYWSLWPNTDTLRSKPVMAACALWSVPLFAFWIIGAWNRRRDTRAIVLLAGPILYFCALHMIFAGSMRYRIPGEVPALGLAAMGLQCLWARLQKTSLAQG